jgi:preprotein translocase subunit SecA
MLGIISKLFGGSKSDRDVKMLQPIIGAVNEQFEKLQGLSNDQLRGKTAEFKARIREHLKEIDDE